MGENIIHHNTCHKNVFFKEEEEAILQGIFHG